MKSQSRLMELPLYEKGNQPLFVIRLFRGFLFPFLQSFSDLFCLFERRQPRRLHRILPAAEPCLDLFRSRYLRAWRRISQFFCTVNQRTQKLSILPRQFHALYPEVSLPAQTFSGSDCSFAHRFTATCPAYRPSIRIRPCHRLPAGLPL